MAQVVLSLTYHDLERLLEKDEVGIEVKTAIVEEFAKRKLVTLVRDKLTQEWMNEVSKIVNQSIRQEIEETIGTVTNKWNGYQVTLHPQMREVIRNVLNEERNKLIQEIIQDHLDVDTITTVVKETLTQLVSKQVEPMARIAVKQVIQNRIAEIAREELSSLLKKE